MNGVKRLSQNIKYNNYDSLMFPLCLPKEAACTNGTVCPVGNAYVAVKKHFLHFKINK